MRTPKDAHNAGLEKAANVADLAAETATQHGDMAMAKFARAVADEIRKLKLD